MAKAPIDVRSLARAHTEMAINVLASIAASTKAPPSTRVAASAYLIDRGWGKAPQAITGAEGGPLAHQFVWKLVDTTQDQAALEPINKPLIEAQDWNAPHKIVDSD